MLRIALNAKKIHFLYFWEPHPQERGGGLVGGGGVDLVGTESQFFPITSFEDSLRWKYLLGFETKRQDCFISFKQDFI